MRYLLNNNTLMPPNKLYTELNHYNNAVITERKVNGAAYSTYRNRTQDSLKIIHSKKSLQLDIFQDWKKFSSQLGQGILDKI